MEQFNDLKFRERSTWRENDTGEIVLLTQLKDGWVVWRQTGRDGKTLTNTLSEFLSRFTRDWRPDELDKVWRTLADQGDGQIAPIEKEFQETALKYELLLMRMREIAEERLSN